MDSSKEKKGLFSKIGSLILAAAMVATLLVYVPVMADTTQEGTVTAESTESGEEEVTAAEADGSSEEEATAAEADGSSEEEATAAETTESAEEDVTAAEATEEDTVPESEEPVTESSEEAATGSPAQEDQQVVASDATVTGGDTIATGGTYQLDESATGTITISTTSPVTIVGNGAEFDPDTLQMTSMAQSDLYFDVTEAGSNLTLKDLYVEVTTRNTANLIDFTGTNNTLTIEGTVVLDYDGGYTTKNDALIHVGVGTDLTINGSGTLYLYKNVMGAGIGGVTKEMNGEITFAMTGSAFIKGTRQGAVIGAGSGASSSTDSPGKVTFKSGEYNIIAVARGAAIGGSAGSTGGSTGTTVEIYGGSININQDYSGAAIGGGGYDGGNDSSGGKLYVYGGSLRTYVDTNAANNASTGWNGKPYTEGVNDVGITAQRLTTGDKAVYRLDFDTTQLATEATNFDVKIDGKAFYSGGLHKWKFVKETVDRDTESYTITSTPSNWIYSSEKNLYFYVTGESHTVEVNGESYKYTFDEEIQTFDVVKLEVSPSDVQLDAPTSGQAATQQLTVASSDGTALPTGSTPTFKSSDESVATVDANGLVTAVGMGYATITASLSGYASGTCGVTVGIPFEVTPSSINFDGPSTTEETYTQQLTVTTSGGGALPEGLTPEFTSSDESVATVDANGLVTAVGFGTATITVSHTGCIPATCEVSVGSPVYFYPEQEGTTITVDDYATQMDVYEVTDTDSGKKGYVSYLPDGEYSYTATCDGYYASTCGFTVYEDASGESLVKLTTNWSSSTLSSYGLSNLLDTSTGTFNISLEEFVPSANEGAWDGTTIDVSWARDYATKTEFHISTAEQWAGFAALVNGIYNKEIDTIIDLDASGNLKEYSRTEYENYDGRLIIEGCSATNGSSGSMGQNNVTSDDYFYNKIGDLDFMGKTVYLDADIDMGGWQKDDGTWTGARYMPIGGQYQMYFVKTGIADGFSHLGASFNGNFDGQGHIVSNIYCDRWSVTAYGDSSTIGLFGRVGIHDSDYSTWQKQGDDGGNYPPTNPTVENVAITGYIYGRRSVGGIVGKTGHTSKSDLGDGSTGVIIQNCVNFANVVGTDAKGTGGIVGAGWNGGIIKNCVNFGNIDHPSVSGGSLNVTAGIVGSDENDIINCYNLGTITVGGVVTNRYSEAIASQNGGGTLTNCYWLTGQANAGAYRFSDTTTLHEYSDISQFATDEFAVAISGAGRNFAKADDSDAIYGLLSGMSYNDTTFANMPVPICFVDGEDAPTPVSIQDETDKTQFKLDYMQYQEFDKDSLDMTVTYSDGLTYSLDPEGFTYSIDRPLDIGDTQMVITVTEGDVQESFTYDITVTPTVPVSISITADLAQSQRGYYEGEKLNLENVKARIVCDNDITTNVIYQDGVFVDQTDTTKVVDIDVSVPYGTPEALVASMDGQAYTLSYTLNGTTVTVNSNNTLRVLEASTKLWPDEEGVYHITNAEELDMFSNGVNAGAYPTGVKTVLDADIIATDNFEPIASGSISGLNYVGEFDGQGHSVTVNLESDSALYLGLFGKAGGGTSATPASISNVTVKGSVTNNGTSNSTAYVGGVVAYAYPCTIENCINEAAISNTNGKTYAYVGGIVGSDTGVSGTALTGTGVFDSTNRGTVDNQSVASSSNCTGGIVGYENATTNTLSGCLNTGAVTATSGQPMYVGGVVARAKGATVENCTNMGKVTADESGGRSCYVAGVVGYKEGTTSITGCINKGGITMDGSKVGVSYVGGICGDSSGTGSITSCTNRATGKITSNDSFTGGIAGRLNQNNTADKCLNYADITVTGEYAIGGVVGMITGSNTAISNCANKGDVTRADETASVTGGIVGQVNAASDKVINCYNTGSVTGYATEKSGTAFGVGGIAGYVYNGATISNVYNIGTVVNNYNDTIRKGSIAGYSANDAYLNNITNYVWMEGTADAAFGRIPDGAQIEEAKTNIQMQGAEVYAILGDGFVHPCSKTEAYPVLVFEDGGHVTTGTIKTVLATEATCTEAATYYMVCENCGQPISNTPVVIGEALGHAFGEYVSDGNATYTTDGTKTATCERCGLKDTVTDEGSALAQTPIEKFVLRLYNVVLDRDPDYQGFEDNVEALESQRSTGTESAYGFIFSEEFKNRNLCDRHFVKYLYRSILGREASDEETADWVEVLAAGKTREEVFNGFAQSDEFKAFCEEAGIEVGEGVPIPEYGTKPTGPCSEPECDSDTDGVIDFVYRMYEICLGREPQDNEQSGWVNALRTHENTGTECADGFFNSDEYLGSSKTDEQYVDDLYAAYFGRDADDDPDGKQSWLKALADGKSRDEVRDGFSDSVEFANLCEEYGIIA